MIWRCEAPDLLVPAVDGARVEERRGGSHVGSPSATAPRGGRDRPRRRSGDARRGRRARKARSMASSSRWRRGRVVDPVLPVGGEGEPAALQHGVGEGAEGLRRRAIVLALDLEIGVDNAYGVAFRQCDSVGTQIRISRLNRPAHRTPVNASPTPSRAPTHDSGPSRIATPST